MEWSMCRTPLIFSAACVRRVRARTADLGARQPRLETPGFKGAKERVAAGFTACHVRARLVLVLLTSVGALMTMPAQAGGYAALEGSSFSVNTSRSEKFNPVGLRLRLGTRLSEMFDVEAQFGFAGQTDASSFDYLSTSYAGISLKGYLPVGSASALFASVGFTGLELTQEFSDREFSDYRFGPSFGVGLETELSRNLDLTADATQYLSDRGLFESVSAVSFGLKWYY